MKLLTELPSCAKCHAELPLSDYNSGSDTSCPHCNSPVRVEAFAALFRPPTKASAGELVMMDGESVCFYHENKKAAVVCDACGRFLCGLCDCPVHSQHLCPNCLETGRRKKTIESLDNMRPLYGYQAMLCALVPVFITGIAAIIISLRHWKAPGSLVRPRRRWQMPVALVLGSLQTLGFVALFIALARK